MLPAAIALVAALQLGSARVSTLIPNPRSVPRVGGEIDTKGRSTKSAQPAAATQQQGQGQKVGPGSGVTRTNNKRANVETTSTKTKIVKTVAITTSANTSTSPKTGVKLTKCDVCDEAFESVTLAIQVI